MSKFTKEMHGHTFLNFDVFKSLYLSRNWPDITKLGNLVYLGVFFLTMWINSC